MKKIISILLLAAMLVGCLSSAVLVSAADAALAVESVEKIEGTGTTVAPSVTIANNEGTSFLKLVVYYDASVLAQADTDDALANSIFSEDDSDVSKEYAGSNKNLKAFVPEELQAASKGFVVELYGADDAEVIGDGIVVELPLEIIASELGAYDFTVVVVNEDDEAVDTLVATVNYVADPLVGIYDEFTVFTNPGDADVTVGTTQIDVDVRFDNNPGIWSTRIFVVYPAELTLTNIENSFNIFPGEANMFPGVLNLDLTDGQQVKAFRDYLAANPEVVKDGYRSTTIYFEADGTDTVLENNGVLCTLSFDIAADAAVGDVYDISIHYTDADFLRAETAPDGSPLFTIYEPATIPANLTITEKACEHANTSDAHQDATCGVAGYDKVVCDDCGTTLSETEIPATGEHTEGAPEVTESTCNEAGKEVYNCSVCGEFIREVALELGDHTPGAEATCQAAQTCTVCGEELAAKLDHVEDDAVVTNPTCDEDGKNVYNCANCGEFIREETIPASGHIYLNPGASFKVDATCTEDGYKGKKCDVCGDETITETIPAWGHDEDGEVVIVDSTCIEAGSKTTYCDTCGEISKVEELPLADHALEFVEGVDAYCHVDGVIDFWMCSECFEIFADAEGTQIVENLEDLLIEAENDLVYVPGAEACHVPGISEYWYCPECDCVYEDEFGLILTNRKNLEIAPDCELVHMDKVEACHANGSEEYWFCPECDAVYADEAGTVLTNRMNLTIPADAEAKHVEAVGATCTENGMAEYWYCEECDTFFADAECKYNVAYLSLTIPATGHDYKDGVCSVCGDKDEEKKPSAPVTGDNMIFIVIALAVVLLSGAAIVLFRRKRAN